MDLEIKKIMYVSWLPNITQSLSKILNFYPLKHLVCYFYRLLQCSFLTNSFLDHNIFILFLFPSYPSNLSIQFSLFSFKFMTSFQLILVTQLFLLLSVSMCVLFYKYLNSLCSVQKRYLNLSAGLNIQSIIINFGRLFLQFSVFLSCL